MKRVRNAAGKMQRNYTLVMDHKYHRHWREIHYLAVDDDEAMAALPGQLTDWMARHHRDEGYFRMQVASLRLLRGTKPDDGIVAIFNGGINQIMPKEPVVLKPVVVRNAADQYVIRVEAAPNQPRLRINFNAVDE